MSFVLLGILNSQATGGVVPAPDFLTSAPLWLDAADASTITESGGSVSQWNNKGTLENFTQATSAEQPTTGVSTQNGLNVIDFNQDQLTGATKSQWKFMHDGTTYFFAYVIKWTSGTNDFLSVFGNSGGSSSNIGIHHFFDDRNNLDEFRYDVLTSGVIAVSLTDGGFLSDDVYLAVSGIVDPDASAANRIEYFNGNTQGTVDNTSSAAPSSSDPSFNLAIGGDGSNVKLQGSIGELIVVSGADATETNRQTTVDYLNSKWGVF